MESPHTILSLPTIEDDDAEIAASMGCLLGNLRTLFELRFLVRSATMPDQQRQQLLAGLDHLEGHVVMQARQTVTDTQNRKH